MIKLCSPDHNSTAVLVGDKLYAGTAADYQVPPHHHARAGGLRCGAGGRDCVCENYHSYSLVQFIQCIDRWHIDTYIQDMNS